VDTAITPDLLQVMTTGSLKMSDLPAEGRFMKALTQLARIEPSPDDLVARAPGLGCAMVARSTFQGSRAASRLRTCPRR
jgi:hypothetical protein